MKYIVHNGLLEKLEYYMYKQDCCENYGIHVVAVAASIYFWKKQVNMQHYWSRGSVVGLDTRLQAGRPGIRIPVGSRYFSLLQNVQAVPGAHLASYSVGTGVISRGKIGHGVNHSPPSSAKVKNVWSCTPNPSWRGRGKFYLLFTIPTHFVVSYDGS
jgi:hypothetical protein